MIPQIDSRRIMMVNIGIFVVIVGLAALIMTAERTVPGTPDLSFLRGEQAAAGLDASGALAAADYPNFGKRPIFDTIVPIPPPTPTIPPTPPPDPDLKQAIQDWRVQGVIRGMALMSDAKTRAEWQMKVGDTYPAQVGPTRIDVRLESVNLRNFAATLVYTGPSGRKQTHTISLLDQQQ